MSAGEYPIASGHDPHLPMVVRDPRISEETAAMQAIERGIRQYWRVVLKYRMTIAAVFLAVVVASALYALTATPHYKATSLIRIDSFDPLLGSGKVEDVLQQKSSRQDYLETQIQQLRSLSVADLVLQDRELRSAVEERPRTLLGILFSSGKKRADPDDQSDGYSVPTPVLKRYLELISIVPVRRTMLVNITVTHRNKQLAARIANRHAEAYIEWSRKSRIDGQSKGVEFLGVQSAELQHRVERLEQELAEYAEAHSIVALNKDENIVVQKMARINELLADAVGREVEAVNRYEQAKLDLGSDASAFDDASVINARGELARLEVERAELREKFNPSYPKLQQVEARIETLKKSIRAQRQAIVRGLQTKAAAAAKEAKALSIELETQKGLAFDLSRRQVRFNSLSRELDTTRELLLTVSKQSKEIELSALSKGSNIALVDRAIVPKLPSYPRKSLTVFIGALVGLGLGLFTAFCLNAIDNTIRLPEDIGIQLELPALGYLPIVGPSEVAVVGERVPRPGDASSNGLDTGSRPPPATGEAVETPRISALSRLAGTGRSVPPRNLQVQLAEGYRFIRTNILLSRAGSVPRVILVTSALPGEGKTTVATNLAISIASTGAKVVIVDADLRKPSVHKKLGIGRHQFGMSGVLSGQMAWRDALVESGTAGVSVIPCGPVPPNPAELVGSPQMTALIEELRGAFDFVVIDSAPVVPVTDTVLLGYQVDGVVLVIHSGKTPSRSALEAKTRLIRAGARILGAVLNQADVRGKDYYYYSYSGYSYYQSNDEHSAAA
jgi:capsular exopolysaccharide synthesis family protein